jgi:uncharacterized membrane protein YgcG
MLKYTLQGLCVTGHIQLYSKLIFINRRAKYKRSRVFARLGPAYSLQFEYSKSEKFVLDLFDKPELRLYEIRQRINKGLDEKIKLFKKQYVYHDIKSLGLCRFRFLPTKKGREEKNNCAATIDQIDKEIDSLLHDNEKLTTLLEDLGSNLVFLEKETLDKLKKHVPSLTGLTSISRSSEFESISYLNEWDAVSSFDSFTDTGSSDFDFGGGEGGGGGAGDSW